MDKKLQSIARIAGGKYLLAYGAVYAIKVPQNHQALPHVIAKLEQLGVYITSTSRTAVYFTV